MKHCNTCGADNELTQTYCRMCAGTQFKEGLPQASDGANEEALLRKAQSIRVFTVASPHGVEIIETLGIVFGNSSKQAFWGFSTQADRLSRAYEAALMNMEYDAANLGADAVVGVHFSLNNSTGSSASLAGSSEAVMLLGTAEKLA